MVTTGAGDEEKKLALITKMFLALASGQVSEIGMQARGEAYLFAIGEFPAWVVNQAINNWYAGKVKNIDEDEFKWCPSPAVLARICTDVLRPYFEVSEKLNRLLKAKPLDEVLR